MTRLPPTASMSNWATPCLALVSKNFSFSVPNIYSVFQLHAEITYGGFPEINMLTSQSTPWFIHLSNSEQSIYFFQALLDYALDPPRILSFFSVSFRVDYFALGFR